MLNSIFHAGTFSLAAVAAAMASALVLGLVIAGIYQAGGPKPGGFGAMLAVMPLLVASVILIVNGNLGTSVAVLGAFGLVRFRSAPGTAREIGFLFYAMAVGLAVGMGFLSLGAILTLTAGLAIFLLERAAFGKRPSRQRMLRVTLPEDLNYTGLFDDLFRRYTACADLEQVKTTNMGTLYELTYRVELREPEREKEFLDAVRCRNGNLTVLLGPVHQDKNGL